MGYDFHRLKTFRCAEAIALRVPERWNRESFEDDMWGCYDDDEKTGTLWIHIDDFRMGGGAGSPAVFDLRKSMDEIIEEATKHLPELRENSLESVDRGYLWYREYDVEKDDGTRRHHFYNYHLAQNEYICIISFNFILPHGVLDDSEIQNLIRIMDREIRTARLDPFAKFEREDAQRIFGPLRLVNFDDQVKIMLPEAMNCRPRDEDEVGEFQWYCRLEIGSCQAGMFVSVEDLKLWEEDDHGVEIHETNIERLLEQETPVSPDSPYVFRVPQDTISHDVYDDLKDGEVLSKDAGASSTLNGPLRTHHWRYTVYHEGKARELDVMLNLPLADKNTPPYPDLVSYLDRELRRAVFPGLITQ